MARHGTPESKSIVDEVGRHVRATHFALLVACAATLLAAFGAERDPIAVEIQRVQRISENWSHWLTSWGQEAITTAAKSDLRFPRTTPPASYFLAPDDLPLGIGRSHEWWKIMYPSVRIGGILYLADHNELRLDKSFLNLEDDRAPAQTLAEFAASWNHVVGIRGLTVTTEVVQSAGFLTGEDELHWIPLRSARARGSSMEMMLHSDSASKDGCKLAFGPQLRQGNVLDARNRGVPRTFCRVMNEYDGAELFLQVSQAGIPVRMPFAYWISDQFGFVLPATDRDTGLPLFSLVFPALDEWGQNRQDTLIRDLLADRLERVDAEDRSFDVLGLDVDKTNLLVVSPLLILLIQLYAGLHLQQLAFSNEDLRTGSVAWIGFYRGRSPYRLNHVLAWGLPLVAVIFVVFGRWPTFFDWWLLYALIVAGIAVCLAVWTFNSLVRIRLFTLGGRVAQVSQSGGT